MVAADMIETPYVSDPQVAAERQPLCATDCRFRKNAQPLSGKAVRDSEGRGIHNIPLDRPCKSRKTPFLFGFKAARLGCPEP